MIQIWKAFSCFASHTLESVSSIGSIVNGNTFRI